MSQVIEEISKEDLKLLLDNSFLTGTRAFGLETPKSDWDLVVSINTVSKLSDELRQKLVGGEYAGTKYCFYHDTGDRVYNFIIPMYDHCRSWIVATTAIKQICAKNKEIKECLRDREARVLLFQTLRKADIQEIVPPHKLANIALSLLTEEEIS